MVGYVDDPIIKSKVRFRFDAGFSNTVPDRAEFFYAKCGCYGVDAPGPQPGSTSDLNFQQLHIWAEYAVTPRFSGFVQLPFRWIQPQAFIQTSLLPGQTPFSDQSGFSDMRAGIRAGLTATPDRHLTAQVQLHFPTGDAGKGLGTDHASFEPALLYYQRLSEIVVLESQVGVVVPMGSSSGEPFRGDEDFAGTVFSYGVGASVEVYSSPRVHVAPVVELVGWRVTSGLQTLSPPPEPVDMARADGTDIVNLKVGVRVSAGPGSIYVGYGHGLTDATWYDNILRFEYRVGFGR